jgi:hypothetical protein
MRTVRIERRRRRGPRRRTAVPWEGLAKILTERRRLGAGRPAAPAGWTRGGEKACGRAKEEGAAAGGGRRSPEARAIGIGGGGGELESCPLN